jgi:hypothetical protein
MTGSSRGEPAPSAVRRLAVDRWEGETAVVEAEDGRSFDLPGWMLPHGVREGDVLVVESSLDESGARALSLRVDHEATRAAREATLSILARLRSRDPGGDITL